MTSSDLVLTIGDDFARTATSGALLAAIAVSAVAGLVSFLSPCVLPLVPAYLSYVTGMSGSELESVEGHRRSGRLVLGALLFVLGFTAVFASLGAFFGSIGFELVARQDLVNRIAGVVVIIMGLAFLGVIPGLDRTVRMRVTPRLGLAGAPLLGAIFGVGWVPCIGPTLAAVLTLSTTAGSPGRGAVLTVAYALGLGVPFLVVALLYGRALGALGWVRRNGHVVTRVGGVMLVLLGILLVTGGWSWVIAQLQGWIGSVRTVV